MSKCYASTIVSLCKQEKGYHEKKSNSQLDDKTANSGSNNWNKYADYIDKNFPNFYNGKKNGYEWCDVYVDAMMLRAYGYEDALRLTCQPEKSCGAGVKFSYNYYAAKNRTSKDPVLGAQVFFQSGGKFTHTGIVIDYTATQVLVSAGNTSDEVKETWYNRNDNYIKGYGIPDYDPEPESKCAMTVEFDTSKYNQLIVNVR